MVVAWREARGDGEGGESLAGTGQRGGGVDRGACILT